MASRFARAAKKRAGSPANRSTPTRASVRSRAGKVTRKGSGVMYTMPKDTSPVSPRAGVRRRPNNVARASASAAKRRSRR